MNFAAVAGQYRIKTNYGQRKADFNGRKYSAGPNIGLQQSQDSSQKLLEFKPNQLWTNPGARRIPKQIGRGNGSGKGKTAGRGHKGTYARTGGKINRGFEGGQSTLSQRLPKRGFRTRRFNTQKPLDTITLTKLAYYIQKGDLNPKEPITIKHMFDKGIVGRVKHGVKVLGSGAARFELLAKRLGAAITLEVTDATESVVEAVKNTGGSVQMNYRTPLIMRQYLMPHKFPEYKWMKTPMPPPKTIKKLEKIRAKGIEVSYPRAPWFTDHEEQLQQEKDARLRRIAENKNADLLPEFPADRSPRTEVRHRVQRKQLFKVAKWSH